MTSSTQQDADTLSQPAFPVDAVAPQQPLPIVPAAFQPSTSDPSASLTPIASLPPDPLLQSGDIVGDRYRIEAILGQGGVGITYKAFDQQTGEWVALKALSLRAMQDWKQVELFEREAQILQKLNHPAIPRYIDSFHIDTPTDRAFYIVQQLAEGESLAELVKQGWRSSETDVRAIAIHLLEILTYLHSFDPPVIHRDIKPQNLMRSPDGRVRLVDFGAVQNTYYNTFMRGSTVVGTFGYMAPEQFRGQAVPATDLYGLAATLLFLLTWRSPSELPQHRLKLSFRSRVQVSDVFADWLEKMLEPDVGDRFASAQEALAALKGKRAIGVMPRVPWKALVGISLVMVGMIATNHYLSYVNQLNAAVDAAVRSGSVEEIKLLLEQGADINAKNNDGFTPLHAAVANGSVETVKLLLDHGADVNAEGIGIHRYTPLNAAIWSESVEKVKLLLDHGADVNAENNDGFTPLHGVAWSGSVEMVKLLLDHGADVNARTIGGETVLHMAHANPEIVRLLIEHGAKNSLREETKFLLDHGADINNRTLTPLHVAVVNGSVEKVKFLLDHGADVNAKGIDDYTPLFLAAWSGSVEKVKLLLDHGADVNARTMRGETALDTAHANPEIVRLLIEHGAKNNMIR